MHTVKNVNDVVGKIYGAYEVTRYLGCEQKDGKQKVYWYECRCKECGKKIRIRRSQLKSKKQHQRCVHCDRPTEQHMIEMRSKIKERSIQKDGIAQEMIEQKRKCTKPMVTNVSTGIKHYNITKIQTKCGCTYRHVVVCTVDGSVTCLFRKNVADRQPLNECVEIANELNGAMSRGKEYFKWWYKNVSKKNSK